MMPEIKEPREFPCMDDDPRNNGNGYNSPNPYDDYEEEDPDSELDVDDEETNNIKASDNLFD